MRQIDNEKENYKKRMNNITERALTAKGFFSGSYTIQYNQKNKEKVN